MQIRETNVRFIWSCFQPGKVAPLEHDTSRFACWFKFRFGLRFNVEVRAPLQHALPMQVICEVLREAIHRDAQ